jgi:hypothetical protein
MRAKILIAATALLFSAPIAFSAPQAGQQSQSAQNPAQNQAQSQPKTQPSPAPANSVAQAARQARQNQKNAPAPMVFTNENLPRNSAISVVGTTRASETSADAQAEAAADAKSDERMWRQKFADARQKLRQDQQKLTMLKSDLNALGMVRYFNETDAVSKQQAVLDQEKQINEDQKAIDDLQDALKKAGGDPTWAQ